MKPNLNLSFNGVALTEPCPHCKGEGEVKPVGPSKCPTCDRETAPIETTEEDARAHGDSPRSGQALGYSRWWLKNPYKCPLCGDGFGDGLDWGLEPVWCVDCEGRKWALTPAGQELAAFLHLLDVQRGGK